MSEMLVSFLVIFAVFTLLVFYYNNYKKPMGLDYKNVWIINYNNSYKTNNTDSLNLYYQALKQTIIDSVIALGIMNGAAHVELASTKSGFILFELGARCGGGGTPEPIVHYATGVNQFVELVRILAGDEPKTPCTIHL